MGVQYVQSKSIYGDNQVIIWKLNEPQSQDESD